MDIFNLYFWVFPTHSGAELHFFMRSYNLSICLTEADRITFRTNLERATNYLSGKLWEQVTGYSLTV